MRMDMIAMPIMLLVHPATGCEDPYRIASDPVAIAPRVAAKSLGATPSIPEVL
jgi:hypothetical protein